MRLDVELIIYGYVFICILLLVFNLFYIFGARGRTRRAAREAVEWQGAIKKQLARLEEGGGPEEAHLRRLKKRLRKTDGLIAWCDALEALREEAFYRSYCEACLSALQELALGYQGRDSMERACFAHVVAQHPPCGGAQFRPLMEALLGFVPNSTVYCRENVLRALCALGNAPSVERLLQMLNDHGWFHHQKLLADGLLAFRGDREALAARLWAHTQDWDVNLMVAIVQFIGGFTDAYQPVFLPVLRDSHADIELRLAILRYYRRHPYEPVRALALEFLAHEGGGPVSLAIVAAGTLQKYPGADTVEALKRALCDPQWHVRYNAADSLVAMGVPQAALADVLQGNDRYAREILAYKLAEQREVTRA